MPLYYLSPIVVTISQGRELLNIYISNCYLFDISISINIHINQYYLMFIPQVICQHYSLGDFLFLKTIIKYLPINAHNKIMPFNIIGTSLHLNSVELNANKSLRCISFNIFSSFRQALQINISKISHHHKADLIAIGICHTLS